MMNKQNFRRITDDKQKIKALEISRGNSIVVIAYITQSDEVYIAAPRCDVTTARSIRGWINSVLPDETNEVRTVAQTLQERDHLHSMYIREKTKVNVFGATLERIAEYANHQPPSGLTSDHLVGYWQGRAEAICLKAQTAIENLPDETNSWRHLPKPSEICMTCGATWLAADSEHNRPWHVCAPPRKEVVEAVDKLVSIFCSPEELPEHEALEEVRRDRK